MSYSTLVAPTVIRFVLVAGVTEKNAERAANFPRAHSKTASIFFAFEGASFKSVVVVGCVWPLPAVES